MVRRLSVRNKMISQYLVITQGSNFSKMDSIKFSGAMIDAYSVLYPERMYRFENNYPDLRVTDLFPLENGKQLFPAPAIPMIWSSDESKSKEKRIADRRKKKSLPLFMEIDAIKEIVSRFEKSQYKAIYAQDIIDKFLSDGRTLEMFKEIDIPGVRIDPITNKSTIYMKELSASDFSKKQWIFIEAQDDEFLSSIAYLQDVGVSSRRSTGLGKIKVKGSEFPTKIGYMGPGHYMVLSPFIPSLEDLDNIEFVKSAYNLDVFSGTNNDGSSTGIYRYFKTGSVLYLKGEITGQWKRSATGKHLLNFSATLVRVSI